MNRNTKQSISSNGVARVRMPFGKYKGVDVRDLPEDYVVWLIDTIELRDPLKSAVRAEAEARAGSSSYRRPVAVEPIIRLDIQDAALFREMVERGYRATALICHPDQGGSSAAMRQLSGLVGSLRSQLSALGAGA